jgi:hypothetical protein
LNVGTFELPQGIERLERFERGRSIKLSFILLPLSFNNCSCQKPVKSNTLRKILAKFGTAVPPHRRPTAPDVFKEFSSKQIAKMFSVDF